MRAERAQEQVLKTWDYGTLSVDQLEELGRALYGLSIEPSFWKIDEDDASVIIKVWFNNCGRESPLGSIKAGKWIILHLEDLEEVKHQGRAAKPPTPTPAAQNTLWRE